MPNVAQTNLRQKVIEIIFPLRRGRAGIKAEAADFAPQQWLWTNLANLWSWGLLTI